jgi:transcriptional regulator with XRE-family HTH domain
MQLFRLTAVANFATVASMMTAEASPLKIYRVQNSVTLDALAARLRVNKSTILRWETGEVMVPAGRLADVERETGIPRGQLRPDIFGPAASTEAA